MDTNTNLSSLVAIFQFAAAFGLAYAAFLEPLHYRILKIREMLKGMYADIDDSKTVTREGLFREVQSIESKFEIAVKRLIQPRRAMLTFILFWSFINWVGMYLSSIRMSEIPLKHAEGIALLTMFPYFVCFFLSSNLGRQRLDAISAELLDLPRR